MLAAAVALEFVLSRRSPVAALTALGLMRAPARDVLLWTVALSALLLCFFPAFALIAGAELVVRPDAGLLMLSVLAQGGIAEETVSCLRVGE